jgi:hypothetical protein
VVSLRCCVSRRRSDDCTPLCAQRREPARCLSRGARGDAEQARTALGLFDAPALTLWCNNTSCSVVEDRQVE